MTPLRFHLNHAKTDIRFCRARRDTTEFIPNANDANNANEGC